MSETLYRIAHISDLHIHANYELVHGLVDTCEGTRRVIRHINALDVQPDVVVVSGDITHEGGEAATANVKAELAALKSPYIVCLGNHDCRQDFMNAFGVPHEWDRVQACVQSHYSNGMRFLVIDTVVTDPRSSGVSPSQLLWLRAQFVSDPRTPTVLVMHHPPFDTGIGWLDSMGLAFGRDELADVVQSNSSIVCILSGHLHRPMWVNWAGVPAYAGPSVMNQIDMAPKGSACPLILKSPPGYALYDYGLHSGLQAQTVYLDQYSEDWQLAVEYSFSSVA